MWQSLGTMALAGAGAFLATIAAKFVESLVRKSQSIEAQRDADLAEMLTTANLIGQLSEKYWTKSAIELASEEQVLRSHLVAAQHHLAEINSDLFTGKLKQNCDLRMHRLLTAATGGDFGDAEREAEPGRLTDILISRNALVREAMKCRRSIPRKMLS